MTGNEIKKAFETMKRELAKETGFNYRFSCTTKQIENRTATILVCNDIPYEKEIEREKASDKKVQGYDTWTKEEKQEKHNDAVARIKRYEANMAKFQTKENELKVAKEAVKKSTAFKRFESNFKNVSLTIEAANGCYYVRFNY